MARRGGLRQRLGAEGCPRGLGALSRRPLGLGRPVGLDVGGRCTMGLCGVPLRALGLRRFELVLGAGAGAIVAVPTTAFAQSRPVAQAAVRVTPQTIANAPVAQVAAIAPVQTSIRGAAQAAPRKPPEQVAARPVVVRNTPPAPPPAFTA